MVFVGSLHQPSTLQTLPERKNVVEAGTIQGYGMKTYQKYSSHSAINWKD